MTTIKINTAFITLVQFLKWCGVADNGGMANQLVRNGDVQVNGEICQMRGKKLRAGDIVQVLNQTFQVE